QRRNDGEQRPPMKSEILGKSEIRNPKSEIRTRNSGRSCILCVARVFGFRILDFGFGTFLFYLGSEPRRFLLVRLGRLRLGGQALDNDLLQLVRRAAEGSAQIWLAVGEAPADVAVLLAADHLEPRAIGVTEDRGALAALVTEHQDRQFRGHALEDLRGVVVLL